MQFDTYVADARRSLLRFARVLTHDPELAQDLVQDVLLRAQQRWSRIERADNPHAYVRRMLINEVTTWHRKWGRVETRPDYELDHAVADTTEPFARRDALLRELRRLPAKQCAAVALRFLEDLSDAEIAAALGCSEATVRVHIHRALKRLRVDLAAPDATVHSFIGRSTA